jgi:ribose 1,5-bisphosphokinase
MRKKPGRLVCLMGPSGAGKDTLIAHIRERVDPAAIAIAHRYITRPAEAGGENHVALSPAEFAARKELGLFALTWESHGYAYGIGSEINLWLAHGLIVIVNAARAAWAEAARRYPATVGVLVSAAPEILAERLASRGREDKAAIAERLQREVAMPDDPAIQHIDNSGTIEVAGEKLLELLRSLS